MSKILVYVQHTNGKLLKASLVAIKAAQELQQAWKKDGLIGVCVGPDSSKAAEEAASYGLETVFAAESPALEHYLAVPYAKAVLDAFEQGGCDTLVGAATSTVKDFFPRIAAQLDAGQASDIIAVNDDGSLRRPMYAGNILADVEISTPARLVTVRSSAFLPAAQGQSKGVVKSLTVSGDQENSGNFVSAEISSGGRPELGDAEVVVSGGRALQSAENFEKFIFPLADVLGAAVGASRAAVDSGFAPNDWQVGQTGKVVAPNMYLAVGISGAIQHLAGMKDSKLIVAINKDADAPIFEVADYGLVADLYTAIPELTEAIKKAKSS